MFFRFPELESPPNPTENSAADMQRFLDYLDDLSKANQLGISSYLRGRTGFKHFRQLVKHCLIDDQFPSIIWADDPDNIVRIKSSEMPSEKICHLVRQQMRKMIRAGAVVLQGFESPVRSLDVVVQESSAIKRSKMQTVTPLASSPTVLIARPRRLSRHSSCRSSSAPTHTQTYIDKSTQTDVTSPPPLQPNLPITQDASTQTAPVTTHTVHTQTTDPLQLAFRKQTAGDIMKDKCFCARERLNKCIPSGFHLTSLMIVMLIKFVYYFIIDLNWGWTQACVKAAEVFKIKRDNVYHLVKLHRDSDTDGLPVELPQKKRGRGSEKFKTNDVDERFAKLKKNVLVDILEYVRLRNTTMKGVCTVRGVQAHIFKVHRNLFPYHTIWYAMKHRLGLRYKTACRKRIVFTEARLETADDFVLNLDEALKLQAQGSLIIVYMDESYVHTNHMPSKCWQETGGDDTYRVERSRSKGTLTIIVHAMTRDGWLCCYRGDGARGAPLDGNPSRDRPKPSEFHEGKCFNCEMVFRSKHATGDYHDNFDGDMFAKWLKERLIPTFKKRYPGKRCALVLDNAPYHHVHPENSFFCNSSPVKSKEEIQSKLEELGVDTIDVQPYANEKDWAEPPADHAVAPLENYEGWIFCELSSGVVYMVDGVSNQGYGDVMVYVKVTSSRLTTVESTLLDDWRRLCAEEFLFLGHGPGALRAVRSMMVSNKLGSDLRRRPDILKSNVLQHARRARETTFTYDTTDLHLKYNGAGGKGTGGPRGEWLRHATDEYIKANHPELRYTRIMQMFADLNWLLVFTVPYWAKSQPAELGWAYVKNYVAFEYYPGRTQKDVRKHVLAGMYGGPKRDGGVHAGVDSTLTQKFILHTHIYINEYIEKLSPTLRGRGTVGNL